MSPPEEGNLKESRDEEYIIIMIDSTLHDIIPPQLKNMSVGYIVMCGFECCISDKSMHSYSLS